MINSASPVQAVTPLELPAARTAASANPAGVNFQDVLRESISRVENSAANASAMVENFISGDTQDLHTVALAAQKAGLEMDMFLQVRNKLVQAYQEVMRMQL
jgi:flagellar hook-basal body complex protein FliE